MANKCPRCGKVTNPNPPGVIGLSMVECFDCSFKQNENMPELKQPEIIDRKPEGMA